MRLVRNERNILLGSVVALLAIFLAGSTTNVNVHGYPMMVEIDDDDERVSSFDQVTHKVVLWVIANSAPLRVLSSLSSSHPQNTPLYDILTTKLQCHMFTPVHTFEYPRRRRCAHGVCSHSLGRIPGP